MTHTHETAKEVRERIANMLLEELKNNTTEEWFYISIVHIPSRTFHGGYVLQGRGPTDAWHRMHALNICPKDCETRTMGPIEKEVIDKIPNEMRYKLLTKEETIKLGE